MCIIKNFLMVIFALLSLTGSLGAQDNENIELVGRFGNYWNAVKDMVRDGNHAFLATGISGLQIVDISDPEDVHIVGFWDNHTGRSYGLVKIDGYVYLADGDKFCIIDVSDLSNPFEVSSCVLPLHGEEITVLGEYAYIAEGRRDENGNYGVSVLNISDLENPQIVGHFAIGGSRSKSLESAGNILYVLCRDSGFRIYDVSEPENLGEVASCDTPGDASDMKIRDEYVYVADGDSGLCIIDISNPERPERRLSFGLQGKVSGISLDGDYIYVSSVDSDFHILDVSEPENPIETGHCELGQYLKRIIIFENFAYVSDNFGRLFVVDISNPESPSEFNCLDKSNKIFGADVSGDYACIAEEYTGIRLIDVSSPERPEEVGFYETRISTNEIHMAGDLAFFLFEFSLQILNISNPEDPRRVGEFVSNANSFDLDEQNDYAFLKRRDPSMEVIDVTNPEDAIEIASINIFEPLTNSIIVNGDMSYIDGILGRLSIVDISDPVNPFEVNILDIGGDIIGGGLMAVKDDYVYIGMGDSLYIIDISDPENPTQVGFYDGPLWYHDLAIFGDYLVIAGSIDGIEVLDISNPEEPERIGFYNTPGTTFRISLSENGLIYVADETNLGIYYCEDIFLAVNKEHENSPGSFLLNPAYPNPFNSKTLISYQLSNFQSIDVSIYDMTGQRVAFLDQGRRSAGYYDLTWDGAGVASGVYFVRLVAGDYVGARKVVLVR